RLADGRPSAITFTFFSGFGFVFFGIGVRQAMSSIASGWQLCREIARFSEYGSNAAPSPSHHAAVVC
ncbi:MAG: hypothetical protein K8F58_13385, partial [Bauldia sp.]|nr:hypothetical protein [Bauldia sp.]